jgi:ABC-2 type transport system ATP-binding protein
MEKNIISVNNLTKVYGTNAVVDNISFNVSKGIIFAFLGPNGAGKSTTIKMLTTILKPTAGDIFLNGYDIKKESLKVRESFGIVFQDPSVDDELTAYENMKIHAVLYKIKKEDIEARIKKLLNIVELYDRKDDYVSTFSGGMKRRLEIARGLLHIPKILFLDEPTVGLDPQTRKHIWEYILKINKEEKTTIFFTTHYMDEVEKVANKVSIIDKGKIIKTGTIKEIIKETKTKNLEDAFIKITGYNIREEEASALDRMKLRKKITSRR